MQIAVPVVDLCRSPEGARDRQVVFGEAVTQFLDKEGWSLIQANKDSYVGYVPSDSLTLQSAPTHWVSALATHVYQAANLKSADLNTLTFGSQVTVTTIGASFAQCAGGYIPQVHLSEIETFAKDPVTVAERFIGTPYLWGGNSRLGIDCSGLIQAALLACGIPCPGDSDQQETALGAVLASGTLPQRGDLLFWKGHVAMVVDPKTIIHASGHPMAVVSEPLEPAIKRIKTQEQLSVSAHKRL
ncbi:MAG: C40 family peptidase [Rhodobacteraceae bacterium]|nr:C40 family peptidase [Paracoccaceae bacterium]